jgi:acetoacetyl-CoA synthetase
MPNIPETTASFLAVNGTGAVWSSCSPDFGTASILDRFQQVEPSVLIAVDGYQYNGKFFDTRATVQQLIRSLPSLRAVLIVRNACQHDLARMEDERIRYWDELEPTAGTLTFERVPFQHPQWVLFSSGTTGLPKAITHSVGGMLLEQFKYGAFHNNFKPGDRCFWFTTTGWMMWNYIHGSLLAGGTLVLFDGSPAYPNLNTLWRLCAETKITYFGTSASFIMACKKAGIHPGQTYDLSALQSVGSTGSPLPPEGFQWIYDEVKRDVWLASMSGGTDVCSAFVGGNPLEPVNIGEIQCRALGCALESWSEEGEPLTDEEGELVITRPMPCMPVYFWNDPEFKRYKESYFEYFPGVWRHGDWIRITPRNGIVIYGRSDATLNRGGVRIGTSEIYRAMDEIPEVADSLIVCIEQEGGNFWMPLFVKIKPPATLNETLTASIRRKIRENYSPRHVPDEIIEVPDIPYTLSGKKTETPVKKILMGKEAGKAVNTGTLRNPESVEYFVQLYRERNR